MSEGGFGQRQYELHLREYDALRREIEAAVQESRAIERYALVACAGVIAWLFAAETPVPGEAWWIPLAIALLGGIRALALLLAIRRAALYIMRIETALIPGPREATDPAGRLVGWEHYINPGRAPEAAASGRRQWRTPRGAYFATTGILFWLLLAAASIYVGRTGSRLVAANRADRAASTDSACRPACCAAECRR